jgi:hypothetical protein
MLGLSPEERQKRIEQIYKLIQSLRQPAPGLQFRGCRQAAISLLVIGVLFLLGYVFYGFSGDVRLLLLGIIAFTVVMSVIVYLVTR